MIRPRRLPGRPTTHMTGRANWWLPGCMWHLAVFCFGAVRAENPVRAGRLHPAAGFCFALRG